jgi:hypothetical protein
MILQLGSQHYSPQRIFCIGKNYAEHVKELGGSAPGQPVVFMKPVSCLVPPGETIRIPAHGNNLHHEAEVVVLIGAAGKDILESDAASHIAGLTLGLDLTLRDVQSDMKKKGWPWEISKAGQWCRASNRQQWRDDVSDSSFGSLFEWHLGIDGRGFDIHRHTVGSRAVKVRRPRHPAQRPVRDLRMATGLNPPNPPELIRFPKGAWPGGNCESI